MLQRISFGLSRRELLECVGYGEMCIDCLFWARRKFEDYFSNHVKKLTCTFLEIVATSGDAPFWSSPKCFPKSLEFNSNDPSHMSLITTASALRANTYGIHMEVTKETDRCMN